MIDAYHLDELLVEWHRWCRSYVIEAAPNASAMFKGSKTSRQWDSENEVSDGSLHNADMENLDFHIWQLEPIYRTAIQINARNLSTGRSVWNSERLPTNVEERQQILRDARNKLCAKL